MAEPLRLVPKDVPPPLPKIPVITDEWVRAWVDLADWLRAKAERAEARAG